MDMLEYELAVQYSKQKRRVRYDKKNAMKRSKRPRDDRLFFSSSMIESTLPISHDERLQADFDENIQVVGADDGFAFTNDSITTAMQCETQDDANFHENCFNDYDVPNEAYAGVCDDCDCDCISLEDDAHDDDDCNDQIDTSDLTHLKETNPLSTEELTLHDYTSVSMSSYCSTFASLSRKAKLCKSHTKEFLSFIKSGLPFPNNMPCTEQELLSILNVDHLFTKQSICLSCTSAFDYQERSCPKCGPGDKTSIAYIYNADVKTILERITRRLSTVLDEYKKKIDDNNDEENTKDVPFGILYRRLLKEHPGVNILSLLLHIDGIGIAQSTKLKMWMFSGAMLELPPKFRYRRFNMVVISIWIGYIEPPPKLWMENSIHKLKTLKNQNIHVGIVDYKLRIYGITGDCPALKLVCNFIGHNGYYCCYFCYVRGEHVNRKRQYYYEDFETRSPKTYSTAAKEAELTQTNVYGHLGESVLQPIIDIPFPHCIVLDYLHVTLLGHAKAIILSIYRQLTPKQRSEFDNQVKKQVFPHFFHRKMRSVDQFGYVKAIEVRNLLFYGLLSNLDPVLPVEQLAHLALFICTIRLLHHGRMFDGQTSNVADRLFKHFYQDHELFYANLQNFKLHLHSHYPTSYDMHGAFSNVSCFGPEDLIGGVSDNTHGTVSHGDSITYYYEIEFHLQEKKKQTTTTNGPRDLASILLDKHRCLEQVHQNLCGCDRFHSCCIAYRRFVIRDVMFHSLEYEKRQRSISYFVQYTSHNQLNDHRFGAIQLFFTCANQSYALIKNHRLKRLYSDRFKQSDYYFLLQRSLDSFYFLLEKNYYQLDVVQTDAILNHCIVVENDHQLFVTGFYSYNEHD